MIIKTKVENKDVLEYYNDNKLNFRVYLENDENPKSGLILGGYSGHIVPVIPGMLCH